MDEAIRLRVRESPTGGSRIAYSYLAALVGAVIGGLVWAGWAPLGALVCGDGEDVSCRIGWLVVGAMVGGIAGWALTAWVMRLGWEWWAVLSAVAVGTPVWSLLLPVPALVVGGLLSPALAGLITLSGPVRPRWRPWAVGVGALLVVAGLAVSVWWPGA